VILNEISVDAVETGMANEMLIHLVTYGNKSELVIDRVSAMQ